MASEVLRMVRARWIRIGAALAVVGLSVGTAAMLLDAEPKTPTVVATAGSNSPIIPGDVDPASGWMALTAFERSALEPLRNHWSTLDAASRTRWTEVADHLKGRPEAVIARAQRRMQAWQRLTPEQRNMARSGYAFGSRFTAKERHARWLAYQTGVRRPLSPAQGAAGSTAVTTAAPPPGQTVPLTSVALPIANEPNATPLRSPASSATPVAASGRDAS